MTRGARHPAIGREARVIEQPAAETSPRGIWRARRFSKELLEPERCGYEWPKGVVALQIGLPRRRLATDQRRRDNNREAHVANVGRDPIWWTD